MVAPADWMTVTEAGEYLGVSRTVAYDMVKAGTMPVVNVNRGRTTRPRLRVSRKALDEAMATKQAVAVPPRRSRAAA